MSRKASALEASNDPRQLGPATRSRAGSSGTVPPRAAPKVEAATPDCNTHASSSSGSRKRKSGDDSANQTGPTITIAPNPEPVKQKAAAAGRRKPASNPALHEAISETVALPAAEALPESSAAAANQPKDEAKPRKAAPPQDWFEQLFGFVEGADGEYLSEPVFPTTRRPRAIPWCTPLDLMRHPFFSYTLPAARTLL